MRQDPFYRLAAMMDAGGESAAAEGILLDAAAGTLWLEGRRITAAGWNRNVVRDREAEGGRFLCLGGGNGWYVLCRLAEERTV